MSGPTTPMRDYPVKPVPFTAVHLHDVFWAPKIETNRAVTIPFAFQKCEETGRVDLFERAAKVLRGEPLENKKPPGYPFDDTDIYKVLEGASYALSVKPDPKLEAYVDSLVAKIAAAQEPDGYLYTTRTIDPVHPHAWSGAERWVKEEDNSHELYDLGHLYEAAVAHYQATGKKTLLNVALKSADLLDRTFGPGKRKIWPGHQIVEMGLVKLSRVTGDPRYTNLAKFFLDSRGGSGEYWQAHKPPVDQTEAVGHAVRASYMYSGMADVAAMTGDVRYLTAIDKIWDNVVSKKLYITGGIGATGAGEAFGQNYELPNMSAYCETCAAVGNDYWNQRLFLLHKDAKYVDVFERTLYNGLISGVSLDGKGFFYPNPLESRGQHARSPWFGVACCPGNITRFMASVPGYFYAQDKSNLYVNLYAAGSADIKMDSGRKVQVVQETTYPWNGDVKITVNPDRSSKFALNVRIPGWARNKPVPSDLYRFAEMVKAPVGLKVNGKEVPMIPDKGYVALNRTWKKGDVVELSLPMPVRRVVANSQVAADQGLVALQRGPVVYCAEWPDNGGKVRNLMVPNEAALHPTMQPDLLGGVVTLNGTAETLAYDKAGKVVSEPHPFVAIPYYTWANRGRGEMEVWLPNTEASAHPTPQPTIASQGKITTSRGTNPTAINDLSEPKTSEDETSFFHWWPRKGTTEWVELTFKEPATVSETEIYWFDDTHRGECRVPESWRLLYKDGDQWKPVETTDPYGVKLDAFNRLTFKPVTTSALRVEVKLQPNWSAGVQEWKVK
ncbi:glycoside hydrolase family 127 protein [Fimbriimonas ginsengisoli]|nr:glycoside hydrolase family 127 protein [Fimbriimonas ginsengisoli]